MQKLFLLMSFMTRIPVKQVEFSEENLGKSMIFFPIVGFIISLILFLFLKFLFIFTNNTLVIATLICLLEVILTGGLHLDGLADTFDAIFSYRDKNKMLEIMKDSRIGTNGVLVLIFYFILKIFLLAELFYQNYYYVLIVYPVISRLTSVLSCAFFNYARENGMGKTFVDYTYKKTFIISAIFSFIIIFLSAGISVFNFNYIFLINIFVVPLITLFNAYLFSFYIKSKIGGITGDTLGAVVEISEIFYLLLVFFVISY